MANTCTVAQESCTHTLFLPHCLELQFPLSAPLSRFMPRVEIVQKHNTAARRLYIRGHNGKIYPYLVMNDACLTESRREERVLQLLRLLNPCLEKRKETTKRHLFFTGMARDKRDGWLCAWDSNELGMIFHQDHAVYLFMSFSKHQKNRKVLFLHIFILYRPNQKRIITSNSTVHRQQLAVTLSLFCLTRSQHTQFQFASERYFLSCHPLVVCVHPDVCPLFICALDWFV